MTRIAFLRIKMETDYFIRKALLILDAGSLVLRYFIEQNEAKLPDNSVCAFVKDHEEDIQTSNLLQSQKYNLMTTDIKEWDFSMLSFAITLMAACIEFDEEQKRLVSFLKDHRDMLHYSALLEVRESSFNSFSKCFNTGLDAFSNDFDVDFIYDIRALISEINSANIEQLKKSRLVRNELCNILLKEHISTDNPERKSEIQHILTEQTENSFGHITVDLHWLPDNENEQVDVHRWFLHANLGTNSEAYTILMNSLTSFGVKDDNRTTSAWAVLNCQPAQLLNLLQFLDGSEFCQILKDISLEISNDSGKEVHLTLKDMHVFLPESRHETDIYAGFGDEQPSRFNVYRRQEKVSEMSWRNLKKAIQLCREEKDLWTKFGNVFSKISDEIEKKKDSPEMTKIIVIGEPYSGAYSFMNMQLGQDVLPPSPFCITRIKHRKNLSGVLIETNLETSSASFVNRALSYPAVRGSSSGKEKTEKVVVVWPFKSPILLDGIEWIFVPETAADCEIKDMMDSANGLLYIANAGSSDCLKEEKIRKVSSLDWRFPVIILNRWNHLQYNCNFDFGEPSAGEHAYNKIMQQLKVIFPNMNEKQALRFRMTEVADEAGQKIKARRLLEDLIENSRSSDSAKGVRWFRTKVSLIREKVKEMKTEGNRLLNNIEEEKSKLKRNTKQKQQQIEAEMNAKIRRISQRVVNHVKSQTVRAEMADWTFDDFPCSLVVDSNETIQREVQSVISKRLGRILERDMKSELEQYRKDMLNMFQIEIAGITQQFQQAYRLILDGSFGTSIGANFGIGLATFFTFGLVIEQTLTGAVLWGTFFSLGFLALGLILLPLLFVAAALSSFRGNPFSTPHTNILRDASKKVIDGFREEQIKEQFEKQLKEVKKEIDKFFRDSVPAELAKLDEAADEIRKTLERYDEIIEMLDQTQDVY